MDATEVWSKIKERLKNTLDEYIYEDYFANVNEIYKEQNNNIYLVVENPFYKKRIQNEYLDRMNNMLQDYYPTTKRFYLITKDEMIQEEENKKAALNTEVFSRKNNSGLNPDYTFSNFVVGNSNRFAHRYAVLVADQRTNIANPIYIFGSVGLGKTHLMQAIGNAIIESDASAKVLYIGTQDFIEEYVKNNSKEAYERFSEKFSDVDVLLVDDIQFLETRNQSQMEFFKIFERLSNNNKLILLTSDKKASDLTNIMGRLTSRFEKGLSLDINKPDKEHRIQILNSKLKQDLPHPEEFPAEVIDYIATVCDNNVRQLEGCLKRVLYHCAAFEVEYSVENAKEALKNIIDFADITASSPASNEEIKRLISTTCSYFKLNETDLLSNSRKQELVYARQICWYLLKTKYELTFKKIGSLFGGKDHSTIMHGCNAIEESLKIDNKTKLNVDNILRRMDKDSNAIS